MKPKKPTLARKLWQRSAPFHSARAMFYCGVLLVTLFAATITLASVMHLCKIPIGIYTLPLALLLTAGVYALLCGKERSREMRCGFYSFLIAVVSLTLICSLFYEMSWDGNAYHKPAIGAMANGWNPMFASLQEHWAQNGMSALPGDAPRWADHYAKAGWLFAASIYKITGNIESGKAYHPMMVLALFSIAACYLAKRGSFSKKQALTIAALTAVNPITLPQLLSYTNDGLLSCALFLVILCLGILMDEKSPLPRRFVWCAAVCGILVCVNVKFTGLAYAGVFCVLFYVLHVLFAPKGKKIRHGAKLMVAYAVIFCTAVFVIGSSTYVKNTLDHGHPFFPLMGAGASDIISHNQPESFDEMPNAEKLFRATFSQSANPMRRTGQDAKLKIPFLIHPREFAVSVTVDTRIGGFGPWFSGILLLALAQIARSIPWLWREKRKLFFVLMGNLLLIFTLLLGISDAWWARYSPFFYCVPLMAYALFCLQKKDDTTRKSVRLQKLVPLLLVCNTAFFLPALLCNFGGALVYVQNQSIQKEENPAVYFDTHHRYAGIYYNIKDLGVDFTVTDKKPKNAKYYYLLNTQYESEQEESAFVAWVQGLVTKFQQ